MRIRILTGLALAEVFASLSNARVFSLLHRLLQCVDDNNNMPLRLQSIAIVTRRRAAGRQTVNVA